jgi:hypothetical protein
MMSNTGEPSKFPGKENARSAWRRERWGEVMKKEKIDR